ncbi:MAG: tetratricopeptide repeat-containing sensor histidine kinase [Bacteroidetes bacterium]|nr:tetratricopeptide repeat-containing sensor histidine kinase [Bacteroidota bacterium]
MKKLILLLFVVSWAEIAHAQSPQYVDSLQGEIKKFDAQKKDKNTSDLKDSFKTIILYQLSRAYWGNSADEALKYANQCLELSKKIGYKRGIGNAYNSIGVMNFYKGNYPMALEYYQMSLKKRIEIKDKNGIAGSYNNIGNVYSTTGNYLLAFDYYYKAKKINEASGNKQFLSINLGNIGDIYLAQHNYTEALEYYLYRDQIAKELGIPKEIASSCEGLGAVYKKMGNYEEAMGYYTKAIKINKETGNKNFLANNIAGVAGIKQAQKNYAEALKYHLQALKMFEEIDDKNGLATTLIDLGRTYAMQHQLDEALKSATRGVSIAKEIGAKEAVKDAYEILADINGKLGNYKAAYDNQVLYKQVYDTIFNTENQKKISLLKMQYDFNKKEATAKEEQYKKDAAATQKIQKEKQLRNSFIIGAILLLVIVLVLINRYSLKQKSNRELSVAYDNLKATQQQLVQQEKLASLGALTAGIAHEIQNPLNFINNFSDLSQELIEDIKTATTEAEKNDLFNDLKFNLDKIHTHGKRAEGIVKGMLQHSRKEENIKSTFGVNPMCDEIIELVYQNSLINTPDLTCTIEKNFAKALPKINGVHSDISRVVLNIVANAFYVVKDKADGKIIVTTSADEKQLSISIKDNGGGIPEAIKQRIFEPFFTTKPTNEGTGLGLSLSYDIIKAHGGDITVKSEEGVGTEFVIGLPLS